MNNSCDILLALHFFYLDSEMFIGSSETSYGSVEDSKFSVMYFEFSNFQETCLCDSISTHSF
jgi:hypothetical protein